MDLRLAALARQREFLAAIQLGQVVARKVLAANAQQGATQAHGSYFFQGKANGLGCGTEGPWTLFGGCTDIAPKEKLGTSVKINMCHGFFLRSGA